ncbi:MAG: cold-shock protein [Candidatus Cloacimonetes bacterium]|nr:cold-shock protein [Candidatus Cloacimonadota bacterium]MCF7813549.1 cold-shock protein [Candidatus Cloacimonadota bacterium]MCF7869290.1 cold-shock protein [Candidatus Cloacimonadota bacterium]MCF7884203.1 cold-shock protein [Candidatus Cloacimonadota bacterium]
MLEGTVKWFNESKGFGFISGEDGQDYFVHHTNINSSGFKTLAEGEKVQFESEQSDKGLRAINVSKI